MGVTIPSPVIAFKGSKTGKIEKVEHEPKVELADNEIAIRVTHSGVCGTDLHVMHADAVLGHEGVGIVEKVGRAVTKLKVGDRAGFGYVHDGCGECEECVAGYHYRCTVAPRNYGEQDLDQGSFSTYAVWPQTKIHRIPDELDLDSAAPFLCAGQTVFAPLLRYNVKKGDRVGVIGIGGLGHLAIQFARALGAEVAVFSSTESKREEATKLGATEFWVTTEFDKKKPAKGVDYLLVTTSKHPDWATYLPFMRPFGRIFPLTVDPSNLVIPFPLFIRNELSITASCTASPDEVEQMLQFAAKHKIKPIVQFFPMTEEGVNRAIGSLVDGTVRYRGILVAPQP